MFVMRAVPPLAVPDQYTLDVGKATVVPPTNGILVNDMVPCGSAVTIQVTTPPTKGTLTNPPSLARRKQPQRQQRRMDGGGFTYTPNNLAAPDSDFYEYSITCDGQVSSWAKVSSKVLLPINEKHLAG